MASSSNALGKNLLFVVVNSTSLTSQESARETQFTGWGYTVTRLQASSNQAAYDTATATVDVVYVSEEVSSSDVSYKLRTTSAGVVNEERVLAPNFGFSTSTSTSSGTSLSNVRSTHPLANGLSSTITIYSASDSFTNLTGTIGTGVQQLATDASGNVALAAIDKDGTLANTYSGNSTAAGRRVMLPWQHNDFSWSNLTTDGLTLAQKAIEWAASDGLIGHWKLDETTGTTAADSSGSGFNGTHTNGSIPGAAGLRGYAASFDGVDDYVSVSGGSSYNLRESVTLSCWAKSDLATWSGTGCLVSKRNQFYLHPSQGSTLIYMGADISGPGDKIAQVDMASIGSIQDWHHYVGVYDYTAGAVKIYVDGVLRTTTLLTAGTTLQTDTGDITFGWDDGITGTRYFDGLIDDVRLYNRVLSDNEVEVLYGRLHHWKFDESSGTTVADSGPGGLDATFATGTPTWATSLRRYGLDFGGNADIQTDIDFDPPETGTVSLWFKPNATPSIKERLIGNGSLWEIHQLNDGSIGCDFGTNASGAFETPAGTAVAGQWRHVVGSYDTVSGKYELYVDGDLIESGTLACTNQPAAPLVIGNQYGDTRYYNGVIDDVVIYDRLLDSEEIAKLYGKLGHWSLDETSGTVAADSTPFGRDGALINGVTPGDSGVRQQAASFDGIDDEITVDDSMNELNSEDAISIAAWIKPNSTDTVQRIAGQAGSNGYALRIRNGSAELEVGLSNSTDPEIVSTEPLEAGVWTHVVGTYNGVTLKLYVDGQLDSQLTAAGTLTAATGNFTIGRKYNGVRPFDGEIDDVAVFDRAMTAVEIAEHYGLVGRWLLDETSGSVVYDSSGRDWNGSYAGGYTLAYATVSNQLNPSVELDGTSGHIALEETDLTFPDGFAYSIWVKPKAYNNWARFFDLSGGQANGNLIFTQRSTSSNISLDIWGTGGTKQGAVSATGINELNQWTHYVASIDASGTASLYKNGDFVTSSWVGSAPDMTRTVNYMGRSAWAGNDYFLGGMADARMYNRHLSADEVQEIYDGTRQQGVRIIRWVEVR